MPPSILSKQAHRSHSLPNKIDTAENLQIKKQSVFQNTISECFSAYCYVPVSKQPAFQDTVKERFTPQLRILSELRFRRDFQDYRKDNAQCSIFSAQLVKIIERCAFCIVFLGNPVNLTAIKAQVNIKNKYMKEIR